MNSENISKLTITEKKENILETSPTTNKKDSYIQSANTLFNFMKEFEYLKSVLQTMEIFPRYVIEDINYMGISSIKNIAIPMTCFCDIKLHSISHHSKYYGHYGIGLDKSISKKINIQPIIYLNDNSNLSKTYINILKNSLDLDNSKDVPDEYLNIIAEFLRSIKPLHGSMPRNGNIDIKNFHDENEWRYIPELEEKMPDMISDEHMLTQKALQTLNSSLLHSKIAGIKLSINLIKYLFVHRAQEKTALLKFIDEEMELSQIDKLTLSSKIIVFEEMDGDW